MRHYAHGPGDNRRPVTAAEPRPKSKVTPSPGTLSREANQVGSLQPTILVSCMADVGPIFDTRDEKALGRYSMSTALLADPAWRTKMLESHAAPTQDFALNLVSKGFAGLLVRSFAMGASALDLNLVLWNWTGDSRTLEVVDDEDRLSRM